MKGYDGINGGRARLLCPPSRLLVRRRLQAFVKRSLPVMTLSLYGLFHYYDRHRQRIRHWRNQV